MADSIEIVAAPFGEAPLWVREAWVGLTLPLAHPARIRSVYYGVLSGPPGWWSQLWKRLTGPSNYIEGYVVNREAAWNVLARHRPDALGWWRDECPLWGRPGNFLFDAPACRPIIECL